MPAGLQQLGCGTNCQQQQFTSIGMGMVSQPPPAAAAVDDEPCTSGDYADEEYASTFRPVKMLLAGGVAGAVSRTATAPVDRLKLIMQVQDRCDPMPLRSAFKSMRAEGTIRAYFRGNGTNVLKIAPETAMKFTLNDVIKRHLAGEGDPADITPLQRMGSGALAGATAQTAIYPLELIRTRLALCPEGMYRGILDAFRKIARKEGYLALYRGIVPNMLGILPYAGVDIAAFETLKGYLIEQHDGHPPPFLILLTGMTSSSCAQFVSYPLALVRTRLQAQGACCGSTRRYTGMVDVIRQTVQHEGLRGLYKGVLPNMMKLAPAAGISWFVFEEVKMLLGIDVRS